MKEINFITREKPVLALFSAQRNQTQSMCRVSGFLSSRPNRVPPTPRPQGSIAPPTFGFKGGDTLAGGRGEGSQGTEEIDTPVLYVLHILILVRTKRYASFFSDNKRQKIAVYRTILLSFYNSFLSQKNVLYCSSPRKKRNVIRTGLNLLLDH